MKDTRKTKRQLIDELVELRQQVAKLETGAAAHRRGQETVERRSASLSLINDIVEKIAASWEMDSVLDRLAHLIQKSFGCNHVAFLTVNRERAELEMKARAGASSHLLPPGYRVELGQGLVGWVGSHGETLLANDVDAEARYTNLFPGVIGTRSELSVPVRVGEEIVGVLDVQSPHLDAFDENDVMVLETLADQVGVAIENARLHETVRQALTERRRAGEALLGSEKRFRTIAESASDAFIVFDSRESIFFWNPAAKAIFGYEAGETQGKVIDSIVPSRFRDVLREEMKRVVSGEQMDRLGRTIEMAGIRKDGGEFPIELSLATWSMRDEVFFTVIARDITERKLAEEELRRMTAELERSNQELQQFAYVASHDLREPLRMVSNYVELLARRYQGRLDRDADDFIAYAVDGTNYMQALISDLLAYSRVGSRGEPFEPTDCEAVLDRILANLKATIEENGAAVTRDPLPTVMADNVQLVQLFQNMVGNAIKFRGEELPRVHVSAEQRGDEWVFSVRDNGIGIDSEHAERIFLIFERLHGKGEYPGTGIGLAVCRKIVERHGGRIWVESQPSEGSIFYFTIPRKLTSVADSDQGFGEGA